LSGKSKLHAFVSGRVQGVFFRASLAREAERLQLTGYVKNLSDGRVEFLAFGEPLAIDRLKQWSYVGPPMAKVSDVEIREYSGSEDFDSFRIEY
jgi:acylphosphatase